MSKMLPMPSPNGTNFERLFLPADFGRGRPKMAMDSAPPRVPQRDEGVETLLRYLRGQRDLSSRQTLAQLELAIGRKTMAMDDAGLEHGSGYRELPHMRGSDDENTPAPSRPGPPLPQDVETVVDQIHALLAARLGASSDGDPELDELIIRLRAAINGEPQTHDKKPAMDAPSKSFRDFYPAAKQPAHVDGRQSSENFGERKRVRHREGSTADEQSFASMFPDAQKAGIA